MGTNSVTHVQGCPTRSGLCLTFRVVPHVQVCATRSGSVPHVQALCHTFRAVPHVQGCPTRSGSVPHVQALCHTFRLCATRSGSVPHVQALCLTFRAVPHVQGCPTRSGSCYATPPCLPIPLVCIFHSSTLLGSLLSWSPWQQLPRQPSTERAIVVILLPCQWEPGYTTAS